MSTVPRWAPRLARLYSEEVRKLEARHAGRLSPGAKTWGQAVEALYEGVRHAGPVKGPKLLQRAIDYFDATDGDERSHLLLFTGRPSKRSAHLMFVTFSVGPHPDPRVREEDGLNIALHVINCGRSRPSWASGIPVAYVSKHALTRLYERGYDITENAHTHSALAFIGTLGFLTHRSDKHRDSGLSLVFSDLLMVGSLHRFDGQSFEERFFDVRTALPIDEIGPSRQALLDQGRIAASVVVEWLKGEDAPPEAIPALPRRENNYPQRAQEAHHGVQ